MGEKLERYSIEFDDFVGTVIGSYTTLDGKEGVVMQQDGTRVVHVYGRKHLKPAQPFAAKDAERASAEAKEGWTGRKCPHCKGTGESGQDYPRACNKCGGTGDEYGPLSPDPHASDCEKQTETEE